MSSTSQSVAAQPAANTNRPTVAGPDMNSTEYVTLYLGEQMFGLPIDQVHDVFLASQIAHVPLAPREIVGLLNLRGKVVTALSLRARLGMPDVATEAEGADASITKNSTTTNSANTMAIGIEHQGEAYALMVDRIGEVMRLEKETFETNPIHLHAAWQALSTGVHRLDGRILVILDVKAVLDFDTGMAA